ncbi:MAG TPA: YncE family protein [Terriglobales bacterium]|nr:YncE family protein [Terriglobales bacterium]
MKISQVWWRGLSRSSGLLLVLALAVFAIGCGDVFRPVAVPIAGPPGDPQSTSFAFALNQNAPATAGSILQINVPGDSAVFSTPTGLGPVHAAFLPPGESRIYVANRDDDTVTTYLPSLPSVAPTVLNLPSGSKPVYVATTETSKMYVANAGGNSVGVIEALQNALITIVPVGTTPVALAETADGKKLYAVNQGSANVSVIDTGSDTVINTIAVGNSPVWALLSPDGLELYVLNQASGTVSVIDTTSDAVVTTLPAGTLPLHMVLDKQFIRLYVVDGSSSNNLWIFDASVDPPVALKTLTVPLANPTSITVLANGLKAYIPSQQITAPALNPLCPVKTTPCALSVVSVAIVNTTNNTVRSTISLTSPVQQVCNAGNALFTQTGGVRFRTFATSSANSNRVYISSCDAGVIHSLNTTSDSLVTDLAAPVSSFAPLTATLPPPPQQPVFVLPGP